MKDVSKPPFRADHVGSLLRPQRLLAARERFLGPQTAEDNLGPHENIDLRNEENNCIVEVIALQEDVGLKTATDGEFRRRSWWLEMIMNWQGFSATRQGSSSPFSWKNEQGKQQDFSVLTINDKITWKPSPVVEAFKFLKSNTTITPKVTMPAPPVVHCFAGGDPAILSGYYSDIERFWDDLIVAYRHEIETLVNNGARYIQLDDVTLPFLCDPDYEDVFKSWGSSQEETLDRYAHRINEVIKDVSDDVTFTMHTCRGNREGLWAAKGGYDPVADALFNQINVDGYFLEYDTPRAGTFEPLKYLPDDKIAVLGLVSSKSQRIEEADTLKHLVDGAAKFTSIENLAIGPQCGFASSIMGNPITENTQRAKLTRLVECAEDIWGEV